MSLAPALTQNVTERYYPYPLVINDLNVAVRIAAVALGTARIPGGADEPPEAMAWCSDSASALLRAQGACTRLR